MKVVVECKIWFSNDISAEELSDACSAPLYGDYATLQDIDCIPMYGRVNIATLIGTYDQPKRLDSDEDELNTDVAELVFDLLGQYGFSPEEVQVDIKDFLAV